MSRLQNLFIVASVVASISGAGAVSPHPVSSVNPNVTENFNSMWDPSTQSPVLVLPEGWAVDRNMTAPRTIGKWSEATGDLMYSGGTSLASNAKNGTWNFGASDDPGDRAVGGLSTTVSGGTRCVSLMTALRNDGDTPVDCVTVGYSIEKYRKGANVAGFTVALHYSYDGETWIAAGNRFQTYFSPDDETAGSEVVPIGRTEIAPSDLLVDLNPGSTLYMAWNISVASGSTPDKAMGLAVDDVSITARFASDDTHYVYVENAIGKSPLLAYSIPESVIGSGSGTGATATKTVNGVEYDAWKFSTMTDNFKVGISAGDLSVGPVEVSGMGDTYLCASASGLDYIDNPENYTGWVDPDRKPFVASGIYLRGEVNSWAVSEDWEFSDEGDGQYVIYDKILSGAFKVADATWSGACNYGSNGTNVAAGSPYSLVEGTDDNISCGAYVFNCSRIVLSLPEAILTLEIDDSPEGLTSVYMVGDFNSWDYSSTKGELKIDAADNLFKGRLSLKGGDDGVSRWMIYQRLGLQGAWGAVEASDQTSVYGTLVKGSTHTVATVPATYDVTFDIASGEYTLVEVPSEPSRLSLDPGTVVLTPDNPSKVKVLSLNNSLIYYNDQDLMFNEIAASMGKDAVWNKHTLLGKSLATHWAEGDGLAEDGTPGAKMLVRSEAWSHIILQEQSSLPRTDPDTFRNSVRQWVDYIREYCPNPNAVIILPVNWAYSSDWSNFPSYNRIFLENYTEIASEIGVVVCPVGVAYDNVYRNEGQEVAKTWFCDDRHPNPNSTYMAACMEYGLIYGEDPAAIGWYPDAIDEAEAVKMRSYAKEALDGYVNSIDHLGATVRFKSALFDDFDMQIVPDEPISYSVDGGGSITSDGVFVSDGTRGTFTVTATSGGFTKSATVVVADHETVVVTYPAIVLNQDNLEVTENFNLMGEDAEAELPEAWRIDRQTVAPRTVGSYGMASLNTTYSGGVNLPSNAKNGLWNFGADDSTDRAPGGITTGVAGGTRAINLYTHLYNDGRRHISTLDITYSIEKYRKGNNSAGFAVQLYYSVDGRNWISAGDGFYTYFPADSQTEGYASVPGDIVKVSGTLPVGIGRGVDLFLAWNISVASGDAAQGAPALAIDDVTFSGSLPEVPETLHRIYVDNRTSWNALGVYAYGDSELFGAWPGQSSIDEQMINGVIYDVFGLDSDGGSFNLIFNNWNNNRQLPDYPIVADRDYYFRIDDQTVEEVVPSGVENVISDQLRLIYDGSGVSCGSESSFTVFSMDGRTVSSGYGRYLSIDGLQPGVYIVTAANQAGSAVIKVLRR